MLNNCIIDSPLGPLALSASDRGVRNLRFLEPGTVPSDAEDHPYLQQAVRELGEYFSGDRKQFTIPLDPEGTPFQREVWNQLSTVAWGRTVSYRDIARAIGKANGSQAVGAANGKNPLPIIIPCHRVIGVNGKLTGYSGGITRKQWLLRHESTTLL